MEDGAIIVNLQSIMYAVHMVLLEPNCYFSIERAHSQLNSSQIYPFDYYFFCIGCHQHH